MTYVQTPYKSKRDATIISYLAHLVPNLSHLQLFKLLFLIDETAMKQEGVQVTSFNYEAWKLGPVPKRLWDYIQRPLERPQEYSAFFSIDSRKIVHSHSVDVTYLSEFELQLIEKIANEFGEYQPQDLINFLHEKGSLWSMFYEAQDEEGRCKNPINIYEAIDDEELRQELFGN